MIEIKGFIMSLVCAAAASALIEGFVPEGGMKKYVKYLISLVILAVLAAPLGKIISELPSFTYTDSFIDDSKEASAKANSIVAMHIEKAVSEKFSIGKGEISVKYNGEGITVCAKAKPWLYAEDIIIYIAGTFGVSAEVSFYE